MTTDEVAYLRYYVAQLVRIWAALDQIREGRANDLVQTLRDVCSDKLRIMLHELSNKKSWTLGFKPDGRQKYERLFQKLTEANKWFEGYKNKLHSRNCSGAHLQPLTKADHMFQTFGYGGIREWKHLTQGVAACIAMMKLIDDKPHNDFWRMIRLRVAGKVEKKVPVEIDGETQFLDIPIGVDALLLSDVVEDQCEALNEGREAWQSLRMDI